MNTFGSPSFVDPSRNGFAIAALVVGLINLCTWIVPLCGCPFALIGMGLGYYGLPSEQRTLAIIGLVLSVIGFGLTILSAIAGAAINISAQ